MGDGEFAYPVLCNVKERMVGGMISLYRLKY